MKDHGMRVLYFAGAARAAGCKTETWDVDDPLSLEAFWTEALRRHPDLAPWKSQCRVASGLKFVEEPGQLDPRREAAVIPPVSGG